MITPAALYAIIVSVLVATALGLVRGVLDATTAWIALTSGVAVSAFAFWREWRRVRGTAAERPGAWEWAAIGLFSAVCARAFLWLVFNDGDAVRIISPNNLGDLSLHLTYIRHLASGAAFWPENPIFAEGKLTYPLGVDLFNALLALVGLDVQRGLIWVGLLGSALTGAALWRWGRGIALIALIGNGGLAALAMLVTHEIADFQSTLAWKNFFLALFVTQRGLLFALPAGLLLLASWRARFFGGPERDHLPFAGELLLYASLPLLHLHTFLFLSLLLGSWFVLASELRRPLLVLVGSAFLPATALALLITGGLRGSSLLGYKPGWMWDDEPWLTWCADFLPGSPHITAPLLFWPVNFGFTLALVAWLGWSLWQDREAIWARALVVPSLLIFLLCVFVKFAPWEWDNTKIMIWSWLAIIPVAWERLLAARPLWQRATAFVALFASGLLSLLGGLDARHSGYDLASRFTLDGVASAVAKLPPDARFVGYPTFNHPVLLAGRKMALGYPGHAWSHGLDFQPTADRIESLMNGAVHWRVLARELRVRYLFWGEEERTHYPHAPQQWKEAATLVASGEWGEIYDLAPALK